MLKDSCCPNCGAKRRAFATGRASLYKCRGCKHVGVKHTFWPELKDQRPSLHWDEAERPTLDGRVLTPEPE